MQRRIFSVHGAPVVMERNGFFETHGTLAVLIKGQQHSVSPALGASTDAAPAPTASPAPEVTAPPVQASAEVEISLADVVAVAPAEPTLATPTEAVPRRPPAKPRKPKMPSTGATTADAASTEEASAEAAGADITPASAEATLGGGSEVRAAGRQRAGEASQPRWKIAGKLRHGRPT